MSTVLRLEVGSRDIPQFDIGRARNVTLDLLEDLPEPPVALGDDGNRDRSPLPLILVVDLRHRQPVLVAEPVDNGPDRAPLRLQRPALWDVEVEADGGGM